MHSPRAKYISVSSKLGGVSIERPIKVYVCYFVAIVFSLSSIGFYWRSLGPVDPLNLLLLFCCSIITSMVYFWNSKKLGAVLCESVGKKFYEILELSYSDAMQCVRRLEQDQAVIIKEKTNRYAKNIVTTFEQLEYFTRRIDNGYGENGGGVQKLLDVELLSASAVNPLWARVQNRLFIKLKYLRASVMLSYGTQKQKEEAEVELESIKKEAEEYDEFKYML